MIRLTTTERAYPWGVLRSTNASKVKFALAAKALSWEVNRLAPGDLWRKPAEILAYHPLGKVPWIEDEGAIVWDSTVIFEYLEERYPQPALLPTDALERARVRMVETFVDEAILVGDLPAVWMPWWTPEEKRDAHAMEEGRKRLRQRAFPWLEKQLENAPAYICGSQLTLADCGLAAVAMVLEVDGMELTEFPQLSAYLERLRAHPAYACIAPGTSLEGSERSD